MRSTSSSVPINPIKNINSSHLRYLHNALEDSDYEAIYYVIMEGIDVSNTYQPISFWNRILSSIKKYGEILSINDVNTLKEIIKNTYKVLGETQPTSVYQEEQVDDKVGEPHKETTFNSCQNHQNLLICTEFPNRLGSINYI